MPSKEYHDKYRAKRNDLFGVFETVFKNPNQLSRIFAPLSGISTTQDPKTKPSKLDQLWGRVVVTAQATTLAVSNIDNVFAMAVGGAFYKKELVKLAITAKGGYELEPSSKIQKLEDSEQFQKQFLAGKIYLSKNRKLAWLSDLEGTVREIELNINMTKFVQELNNPLFIEAVLSAIPQEYIYVYNSETPLFFIELLKDPETAKFITANSAKIENLVTTQANSILSIVLKTIKNAVPKEGQPASVAQVIVTALEEGGVNAKFILDTVSPLIQPIVAELTANSRRLNEFGGLAEKIIITSHKDEKAKFQKEFLSKVASIDFAGTQSIQALSAFFGNEESVANLTKMVEVVAPTLAARVDIAGIDAALIEGSVPIITKTASVLLGKTAEMQRVGQYFTTATPPTAEANAQLVTDLFGLVKTLGGPEAGFITELSDYFVTNKDKMILAAKDVLQKRRDKSPEKALPAYMNDELIDSLIGPAIDALPTVSSLIQPIVAELTANPEKLNEFSSLVGRITSTEDQQEKANLQKEFLSKVASIDFAGTQSIQALSAFFGNEESVANLTKMVEVVAPTLAARVDIAGIDAALIEGSVPIITKTASVLLGKTAEMQRVGQYFTTATLATEETSAKLVKDLSSLVGALQAPQTGVARQLSSYVAGNHMQMRVAVKGLFNKNNEVLNEAQTLNKGFNEALIDSAMNLAVEFSPTLLPFVLNFSQKILDKPGAYELLTLFMLSRADEKNSKAEPQLAALPEEKRADLISNRQKLLAKSADFILQDESLKDFFADPASMPKVKEITGKILDTPALAQRLATLGIEKHLILDAVPILGGTAGALLEKSIDVQGLIKYVYPNPSQPEMTQVQLFTHVSNILEGLKKQNDVFTSILPMYLKDNEILVLKAIEKKENLTVLRSNLKIPSDFSDELLLSVASGGLQVSQDLIPFAFKVASRALDASNKDSVIKIMEQAKKAFTPLAPMVKEKDGVELTAEQLKMQATKRNVDKQKKEKEISSLVNSVLNLKNNDPALKQLIDEGFPTILAKHSELLGGLLDEFLNKTTLGKYVDIRAKDYLEVASRHIPKLIDIAQLYNDKQYTRMFKTRMFLKVFPLIFKKGVLALMMPLLSYHYQEKSQWGFTRRLRAQGSIRKTLSKMLAVPKNAIAAEPPRKLDLGAKLATHRHTGNSTLNSTLNYSLINKDFRGIHFSFKPEVSFQNCILDGFKFNNAKLNTSFDDSEIRNCDFTGVIFTGSVSFIGAVIDERSLKTLIPAIEAYNKTHPNTPIETNITIANSEESFQNRTLNGRNFNNAKLNSSFAGSEIQNCDFTGVVFTGAVSFIGAVIDKSSLETLIPAIEAYNKTHPQTPIETDGIIAIPSEEPGVSHKHQP